MPDHMLTCPAADTVCCIGCGMAAGKLAFMFRMCCCGGGGNTTLPDSIVGAGVGWACPCWINISR